MKIGFYPEIVNENISRLIAASVVFFAAFAIFINHVGFYWVSLGCTVYLAVSFLLRTLWGSKIEPVAKFFSGKLQNFISIPVKLVPGPPKRFAQSIGLIFSVTGLIFLLTGLVTYFSITLGVLAFFAFLESAFAFCAGCKIFGFLIDWGIVPEEVCERCHQLPK